jgi:hypothetical protein
MVPSTRLSKSQKIKYLKDSTMRQKFWFVLPMIDTYESRQTFASISTKVQGGFLAPNGAMSVTNAGVFGRVFGGDSHDYQYVSGSNIAQPTVSVPGPVAGAGGVRLRRSSAWSRRRQKIASPTSISTFAEAG